MSVNPTDLARELIRCPSVTPEDAGALAVLELTLAGLGFECHRLSFSEPGEDRIENLYARLGDRAPNFCFAGHTDVVPVGDASAWSSPPFDAVLLDGKLIGRGAADMKGAIAAFVAAIDRFIAERGTEFGGSISLLITGDEEGAAINGTRRVLEWLTGEGETLSACLVGEPTNPHALGDMIKIGRRGSMNCELTVEGRQGHVAYPELAENPVPILLRMLDRLTSEPLDSGNDHFDPSNLEVTSVDVGNEVTNMIPRAARARFNIRFNNIHDSVGLTEWLHTELDAVSDSWKLSTSVSGEAFLTESGSFTDLLVESVAAHTGRTPELSTTGGTSDARFIKDWCPVAEFGLASTTMHAVDEQVAVEDIEQLTGIYLSVLTGYFGP